MLRVDANRSDNIDVLIRRLKRLSDRQNIPSRLRDIEFYEKPTTKRRQAKMAARKRHLKKLFKERMLQARMKRKRRAY